MTACRGSLPARGIHQRSAPSHRGFACLAGGGERASSGRQPITAGVHGPDRPLLRLDGEPAADRRFSWRRLRRELRIPVARSAAANVDTRLDCSDRCVALYRPDAAGDADPSRSLSRELVHRSVMAGDLCDRAAGDGRASGTPMADAGRRPGSNQATGYLATNTAGSSSARPHPGRCGAIPRPTAVAAIVAVGPHPVNGASDRRLAHRGLARA